MPNLTVSSNVDTMLAAADNAAIRTAIGLGTGDSPTFAAVTTPTVSNSIALNLVGGSGSAVSTLILSSSYTNLYLLGGATAAFPAIRRSGTDINFILADVTSGFTNVGALAFLTGTTATGTAGLKSVNTTRCGIWSQNAQVIHFWNDNVLFGGSTGVGWVASGAPSSEAPDTMLRRSAAGVLSIDSGTAGAYRDLQCRSLSATSISLSGNQTFAIDSTYDIGAFGLNRPRDINAGRDIIANGELRAGNGFLRLKTPANGIVTLGNSTNTDFDRLQFGGTTSSFPAIKRNGNGLEIRLSDDSASAPLSASSLTLSGNQTFATDSTYDIGALNANRPRDLYIGGTARIAGDTLGNGNFRLLAVTSKLYWNGSNEITAPSNGVIRITDTSGTSFDRIQFGGATTSYPAIKRNGNGLEIRLADDSASAPLSASSLTLSGNQTFAIDNTYDIGASSTNRPRNVYVAGAVTAVGLTATGTINGVGIVNAATSRFVWSGRSALSSPADGAIQIMNNAATDFDKLQFGGATSSFPAIARDGAGIKIVGADGTSVSWVKVPPVLTTNLPAASAAGVGARSFVTDALTPVFGNAVTGGGAVPVPVYSTGTAWNVG